MLPSSRRRKLGFWRRCSASLSPLLSRLFVSWETEVFNEPLFNWGVRHSRYLKLWFSLGVGAGLLSMVMIVFSMLLWVSTLFMDLGNERITSGSTQQSTQFLTVVIPGVNVPWTDFPCMVLATTIAVGFHELGHALAAASEGVPIVHAAVFLACIVPGALIALNQESLQLLSPVRALRIYCAGVWHNIMCCTGCYLLLMLFPVVLYPFYVWNQYPVVSNIGAGSPLAGHLNLGDSILKVAGHQLQSPEDWFEFLYNRSIQELAHFNHSSITHGIVEESQKPYYRTALQGFCACSENFTNHQNRLLGSLCPDEALLFYQHLCISAMSSSVNTSQNIYCLKATDVVKCPACSLEEKSEATFHPCSCSESRSCLFPLLSHGEVFVDINVKKSSLKRCSVKLTDSSCEHSLVFVGNPRDLFHSLQLTNYWPRQEGLFGLFPLSVCVLFLKFLERLLMYTFSLSAAMVLLNSAPVFYLDGELVFQAWLVLSRSWVHPRKHKRIMQIVLTGGTILMASFLIFELIRTCF